MRLLFRSSHQGLAGDFRWEESLRLIRASSEGEAEVRARELGRSGRVRLSSRGGKVEWTLDAVERVYAIGDSVTDGTELFSRFLRESEAAGQVRAFDAV